MRLSELRKKIKAPNGTNNFWVTAEKKRAELSIDNNEIMCAVALKRIDNSAMRVMGPDIDENDKEDKCYSIWWISIKLFSKEPNTDVWKSNGQESVFEVGVSFFANHPKDWAEHNFQESIIKIKQLSYEFLLTSIFHEIVANPDEYILGNSVYTKNFQIMCEKFKKLHNL